MIRFSRMFTAFVIIVTAISCNNPEPKQDVSVTNVDTAKIDGHPSWIMQGNIYEVNVRQYTPRRNF